MRKQIIQISSALALAALVAGGPAYAVAFDENYAAVSDEDQAAPAGSFTSDMTAPHDAQDHMRFLRHMFHAHRG